ncbi:MAG: thiamine pyrophosphate-dependent enzyme, partial [Lachnospiraceae bacterium]|nr:thiamine pyrophosphate-dependent enzyme [Lachnospiraceae bacterium]
ADYVKATPKVIKPITDTITDEDIATAVELIEKSKKPYVFVGGGAVLADASEEVREFIHKIDSPVADSLMGKGAFPGTDDLYTGMLGMHGTKTSNFGVSECDLLVVIGARFSDRVTGNAKKFAHHAKILQIDIDPAEINKNIPTHASITGDLKEILERLNKKIHQQSHTSWINQIKEYKEKYPLTYHPGILTGPFIMEEIYKQTEGNAIITTEVGQHQMWAAQFYKYSKPRTFITSGGLGTMGYGLGASIGAKIGMPEKTVINIAGDGCFRMNMNEIATATKYHVPIIQVVFNNHVLGMVRQWQTLFYGKRYSETILDDVIDYVKLAEAMGAIGLRATTQKEFIEAFEIALHSEKAIVIDCQIDCDENVWPMVAPGASISEAFSEEDLEKNKK